MKNSRTDKLVLMKFNVEKCYEKLSSHFSFYLGWTSHNSVTGHKPMFQFEQKIVTIKERAQKNFFTEFMLH
jgi:hypothetical protein